MRPIHEVFSRIRWDRDFGAAEFVVGYYDRVQNKIVRVPFQGLYFEPGDHFSFQVLDGEGECHRVPLHRVREVRRNGVVIWRR